MQNNYYTRSGNASKTSYKVHKESYIKSLPVSLSSIALKNSIKVFSYEKYSEITKLSCAKIAEKYGDDGFVQRLQGKYFIFCREDVPYKKRRWTVAHELGHIFLGHLEKERHEHEFSEAEANCFASELLLPTPVLKRCALNSPSDIASECCVSLSAARIKFDELQSGCGMDGELEKLLILQFGEYIGGKRNIYAAAEK